MHLTKQQAIDKAAKYIDTRLQVINYTGLINLNDYIVYLPETKYSVNYRLIDADLVEFSED